MSDDKPSWPPSWLRNPMTRMEAGIRHWDRASDLARMIDEVAGSDEVAAGQYMADLIRAVPPDAQHIVQKLCIDADSLRSAVRIRH